MDTILYFYKKRGLREPEVEPVGMKTYLLIRVALDVGMEEWFGVKLDRKLPEPKAVDRNHESDSLNISASSDSALRPLRHPWLAWQQRKKRHMERRQEKERRRREEEEKELYLAQMEARFVAVEAAIQKLSREVQEMMEDVHDCFCVYEDSVRKGLVGGERRAYGEDFFREQEEQQESRSPELVSLWRKYFPWEEFNGYFQQFWIEQLLAEAICPHFIILGPAPCLFPLLEKAARRMKSLRWIILESDCNSEFLEFVEDFYTEYGLAIALQLLDSPAALRHLRLIFDEPVNILDFTKETHVTVQQAAKGSIWLDMCSVEEKQRRIAMRGDNIAYISLKEKWRKAQKRCNCPIIP